MPVVPPRLSPIDPEPGAAAELTDGIGLCLSGGGYRAMLFHAGAIWRLNELGLLGRLERISAVSGGALAAAALAAGWKDLAFSADGRAANLDAVLLRPLLAQSETTIDIASALVGAMPFSSAADIAARSYERHICRKLMLADLPARPMFHFNATSLMTGNLVRFTRGYVGDHEIGAIEGLSIRLADAAAASAAFPPFLSPSVVKLSDGTVRPGTAGPAAKPPYTRKAVVADGGLYDNLGLEAVWKSCRTIFSSNASQPFDLDPDPAFNWLQQSLRLVAIMMNCNEDMRERVLAHAYEAGARRGAMWGLSTGLSKPEDRPALLTPEEYAAVQEIPTRLAAMSRKTQALLLKAGYAHATARLRSKFAQPGTGLPDQPDGAWPTP